MSKGKLAVEVLLIIVYAFFWWRAAMRWNNKEMRHKCIMAFVGALIAVTLAITLLIPPMPSIKVVIITIGSNFIFFFISCAEYAWENREVG